MIQKYWYNVFAVRSYGNSCKQDIVEYGALKMKDITTQPQ